jgi:hypothetical protein
MLERIHHYAELVISLEEREGQFFKGIMNSSQSSM